MNVEGTMILPKEKALAAYREYRQAVRENPNARDTAAMLGFKAMAKGKSILNVMEAIRLAGLDDHGRPKLAIAPADAEWCHFSRHDWSYNPRGKLYLHRNYRNPSLKFSFTHPNLTKEWNIRAQVPLIPPRLRPAGDLRKYHILWEANWEAAPVDPLLLKWIAGHLYVVLAAWELTTLERAVMGIQ